ncbi:MAG: LuxR C-terminal-related transcriptional regulator [Microbacteriaceae bacterium]|nr:LuxR C-terminal-related transcriptional regulator [Microbacteriaceae bacterium]MCL2794400.1 LuxR C-terminal-related transcriptional regulator [Microbacteriaceae bacterium]
MTTVGSSPDDDEPSPPGAGEARAVYLAIGVKDWDAVIRLTERHWPVLSTFQLHVLRAAADALPDSAVARHPRWHYIRLFLHHILLDSVLRPETLTLRRMSPRPLAAIDAVVKLTIESYAARTAGSYPAAAAKAREALALLNGDAELKSGASRNLVPTILTNLGISFEMAGAWVDARTVLREAYRVAVEVGDLRSRADAAGELALLAALRGDNEELARRIVQWEQAVGGVGAIRMLRGSLHLARAQQLFDAMRFEDSLVELDLAERGAGVPWAFIVGHRGVIDAFTGAADTWELLGRLDAALVAHPALQTSQGPARFIMDYARAVILDFASQPEAALASLQETIDAGMRSCALGRRAVTLYLAGDYDAAFDATVPLVTPGVATERERVEGGTIRAGVALQRGDLTLAADEFRRAVDLALRNLLVLPLAAVPHEDAIHLTELAFDPGSAIPPELAALLENKRVFPPRPPALAGLTGGEQRVLAELAKGATLAATATALHLSRNTVKAHTRGIYRKLGVSGRSDMIAEARRRGLL